MILFDLYSFIRRAGRIGPFNRYLLVTLAFAVVAAIRFGVDPALTAPFLFLLPPVLVCSAIFGLGAGAYAALLASVIALGLLRPSGLLLVGGWAEALALIVFALACAAMGWLGAMLRASVIKLAQAERENDLLLRELNHRVSNDLSQIVSLLTVQALSAADLPTREALRQAAERVAVIGSVHSQLQQRRPTDTVDLQNYLARLCDSLRIGAIGERPIGLAVSVEPVAVPVRTAIALGLITNELVTNALKHAFPDGRPGRIEVRFQRTPDGAELQVYDDGIGIIPLVPGGRAGLGHLLVRQLADELGGAVSLESRGGACIRILLPRQSLGKGADTQGTDAGPPRLWPSEGPPVGEEEEA